MNPYMQTSFGGGGPDMPATTAQPNRNASILSAWNKSGSAQDLTPLMNQNDWSVGDVQTALNGQGGYGANAAADYFGYHGYSADPTSGALVKAQPTSSNDSKVSNYGSAAPAVQSATQAIQSAGQTSQGYMQQQGAAQPSPQQSNPYGGAAPQASGNLGFGDKSSSSSYSNGGMNPYLDQMAGSITNQVTDNYNRNIAPGNRSGAMAAGGFGGSRQGVVDANSMKDLNQGLGNSLANLYGTGWQNAQSNALQNKSLDHNYDLGIKSNNLGFANLDSNNQQFGANLNLNTLNAQNQWANNGVNAANGMAQIPPQYQQMFQQMQNNIAGQGGSNTSTQNMPGNPWLGALGGFQLANNWLTK